jgi:hypothetical protein
MSTSFSVKAAFWFALLHGIGSVVIAIFHFMVRMGSFTRPTNDTAWRVIEWIWSPLASAAWTFFYERSSHIEATLLALAASWTVIIGMVMGHVFPRVQAWWRKPPYPLEDDS